MSEFRKERQQAIEAFYALPESALTHIALAIELQAEYLLIDERLGRAVAESAGIKVVGLPGTPREAKEIASSPKSNPYSMK